MKTTLKKIKTKTFGFPSGFSKIMDYYSDHEMPSLEARTKALKEYSKTLPGSKLLLPEVLDKLILRIAKETPTFSLTGYVMGGKNEELIRLREALEPMDINKNLE